MPPKSKPSAAAKKGAPAAAAAASTSSGGGKGNKTGKSGTAATAAADALALLAAEDEAYRARAAAKKASKQAANNERSAADRAESDRLTSLPDRWGRSLPGDVLVHLARSLLTDASSLMTLAATCRHWCSSLFDTSVRTDSVWRRAFYTYWNNTDAISAICNPSLSLSSKIETKQSTPPTKTATGRAATSVSATPVSSTASSSWRQKFQRRAAIDSNWSLGRYTRYQLDIPNVAFMALDTLNHRMLILNQESELSLWSRVPPTSAAGASSSPPCVFSINPISNLGTGGWYRVRIIGTTLSTDMQQYHLIHRDPLAIAMNWSRGWFATAYHIDHDRYESWRITVIDIMTGTHIAGGHDQGKTDDPRIVGEGLRCHHDGGFLTPERLPILQWCSSGATDIDDDRLVFTPLVTSAAVIWRPLINRNISTITMLAYKPLNDMNHPDYYTRLRTEAPRTILSAPVPLAVTDTAAASSSSTGSHTTMAASTSPQLDLAISDRIHNAVITSCAISDHHQRCLITYANAGIITSYDINAPSQTDATAARTALVAGGTLTVPTVDHVMVQRMADSYRYDISTGLGVAAGTSWIPIGINEHTRVGSSSQAAALPSSTVTAWCEPERKSMAPVDQKTKTTAHTLLRSWQFDDGDISSSTSSVPTIRNGRGPAHPQLICSNHGHSYHGTTYGDGHDASSHHPIITSNNATRYWVSVCSTKLTRPVFARRPHQWIPARYGESDHVITPTHTSVLRTTSTDINQRVTSSIVRSATQNYYKFPTVDAKGSSWPFTPIRMLAESKQDVAHVYYHSVVPRMISGVDAQIRVVDIHHLRTYPWTIQLKPEIQPYLPPGVQLVEGEVDADLKTAHMAVHMQIVADAAMIVVVYKRHIELFDFST